MVNKVERPCLGCGERFVPRREDSKRCRSCQSIRRTRRAPDKKCRIAVCAVCDRVFRHEQTSQEACGYSCASILRAQRQGKQIKPKASPLRYGECFCGRTFICRGGRRYCSDKCRESKANAAISDRIMGLYRTAIANLEIPRASMWLHKLCSYLADRDGAHCGICQRTVDLTLSSGPRGSDQGPSVDHLIPRSKGGTDDLVNLRLTHWGCNRNRGNRGGDEQLRLIA